MDKAIGWALAFAIGAAGCADDSGPADAGASAALDAASGDSGGADAAGSDGSKADTAAKDVAYADTSGFPDLPKNTPPTVAWQAPDEGAVVAAYQPFACTATVADGQTATPELGYLLEISGLATQKPVLSYAKDGKAGFAVPGLAPGPHKLKLTVTDGMGGSAVASRTVVAVAPLGAPAVTLTPTVVHRGQDLLATVQLPPGVSAADAPILQFAWYRNAIQVNGLLEDHVPGGLLYAGETWRVAVTVLQQGTASPPGMAETTVANSAPTAVDLAIAPTDPTVTSAVHCQLAAAATDIDGDALTYQYAWSLNGVPLASPVTGAWLALAVVGEGGLSALVPAKVGDVIGCSIVATDGSAVGPAAATTATLAVSQACAEIPGLCNSSAVCKATDSAAVVCTCKAGFVGNGTQCYDVNECAVGAAVCDLHADCTNTVGSYNCVCAQGYTGDGKTCGDKDECATGEAFCDLHADCTNTAGSYACTCDLGFVGNGKTCEDIDECAVPASTCDPLGTCVNTPGSFSCTCPAGYVANGQICEDVDECADGSAGCSANATCSNTVGSFECACKPNYAGDGKTCTPL